MFFVHLPPGVPFGGFTSHIETVQKSLNKTVKGMTRRRVKNAMFLCGTYGNVSASISTIWSKGIPCALSEYRSTTFLHISREIMACGTWQRMFGTSCSGEQADATATAQ